MNTLVVNTSFDDVDQRHLGLRHGDHVHKLKLLQVEDPQSLHYFGDQFAYALDKVKPEEIVYVRSGSRDNGYGEKVYEEMLKEIDETQTRATIKNLWM